MSGQLSSPTPTVMVFGLPPTDMAQSFLSELSSKYAIYLHDGKARDPVFTFTEDIANADAAIAFPSAHPFQLLSLIAETEVLNPFLCQGNTASPPGTTQAPRKPIVFLGTSHDWQKFCGMFDSMREQGTLRTGFDRLVRYCDTPQQAVNYIEKHLGGQIRHGRREYYQFSRKQAELVHELDHQAVPPNITTVAFFGSASTKSTNHLERAARVVALCKQYRWNVLHGGGSYGVMGELSRAGKELGVFVYGVTVHESGAPAISGHELDASKHRTDYVQHHIAAKDMIHRMESYALCSNAWVALDGGLGSAEEIFLTAQLIFEEHPCTFYLTSDGKRAKKPLVILNESGIWTSLLNYLKQDYPQLFARIHIATSVVDLEVILRSTFQLNPPVELSVHPKLRNEIYLSPANRT